MVSAEVTRWGGDDKDPLMHRDMDKDPPKAGEEKVGLFGEKEQGCPGMRGVAHVTKAEQVLASGLKSCGWEKEC